MLGISAAWAKNLLVLTSSWKRKVKRFVKSSALLGFTSQGWLSWAELALHSSRLKAFIAGAHPLCLLLQECSVKSRASIPFLLSLPTSQGGLWVSLSEGSSALGCFSWQAALCSGVLLMSSVNVLFWSEKCRAGICLRNLVEVWQRFPGWGEIEASGFFRLLKI